MGVRAQRYFDEAERLGGLLAKIRLASLSLVTSTEAASSDDTEDVVSRLDHAAAALRTEFGTRALSGRPRTETLLAPGPENDEGRRLRTYLQTVLELMTQRASEEEPVEATIRRLDEAVAVALGVERVSTWFLTEAGDEIVCADMFERSKRAHTSGGRLAAADHAAYFEALLAERTIAAHDARTDPRTRSLREAYLEPLGISSMLDVPVWVGKRMVAVICHEHVGPTRTWNSDEERFAYLVSSFLALAIGSARRTSG